jgi:hypothetical protein
MNTDATLCMPSHTPIWSVTNHIISFYANKIIIFTEEANNNEVCSYHLPTYISKHGLMTEGKCAV